MPLSPLRHQHPERRLTAPGHRCYATVNDRQNGKRAALSEARKILRQACHILAELGDDALTAA
jgi:transposase